MPDRPESKAGRTDNANERRADTSARLRGLKKEIDAGRSAGRESKERMSPFQRKAAELAAAIQHGLDTHEFYSDVGEYEVRVIPYKAELFPDTQEELTDDRQADRRPRLALQIACKSKRDGLIRWDVIGLVEDASEASGTRHPGYREISLTADTDIKQNMHQWFGVVGKPVFNRVYAPGLRSAGPSDELNWFYTGDYVPGTKLKGDLEKPKQSWTIAAERLKAQLKQERGR